MILEEQFLTKFEIHEYKLFDNTYVWSSETYVLEYCIVLFCSWKKKQE